MHKRTSLIIEPNNNRLGMMLYELWLYRDLLWLFAVRDLKVRYKQTLLGFSWVIIQPIITTAVFTVAFGSIIGTQSSSIPYPVFALSGMILWQLFARILSDGSISLSSNQGLITKVYFPRLILPLVSAISATFDFCINASILILWVSLFTVTTCKWTIIFIPLFAILTVFCALSFSIWLAALDAMYRDIRYIMGFLVQLWLFATPIIYPISIVSQKWMFLYLLNPMSTIVTGFRWALFGEPAPTANMIIFTSVLLMLMFLGGLFFFKKTEQTLVDYV